MHAPPNIVPVKISMKTGIDPRFRKEREE